MTQPPSIRSSPSQQRAASRWLRSLSRAVSWHRRKLAALAAAGAVISGVTAAAPPEPPSVEVVRAIRQLDGSRPVRADDVRLVRVPTTALPERPLTATAEIVGARLTGPVAKGQVLTQLSLLTARAAAGSGQVLAPLRLADGQLAGLLRPGDRVDVLAAAAEGSTASVVAAGVRVVSVPVSDPDPGIGPAHDAGGRLILVATDPTTARRLAQAAVSAQLSVTLR